MDQYLAALAHELNAQPLPILPETFDLLRLPPPHQRLGAVNFNIVPDSELVLSEDEGDVSSDSEEDVEETRTDDGDVIRERAGDAPYGEGEDEEMEEVGVDAAAVRQDREVDEDYDA